MRIKVETASGSRYHIDTETGEWNRNETDFHHQLSTLMSGPVGTMPWTLEGENPDWTNKIPTVGEAFYIRGHGTQDWFRSSEVVKVEVD